MGEQFFPSGSFFTNFIFMGWVEVENVDLMFLIEDLIWVTMILKTLS